MKTALLLSFVALIIACTNIFILSSQHDTLERIEQTSDSLFYEATRIAEKAIQQRDSVIIENKKLKQSIK